MRVVGGKFKGRGLFVPRGQNIRPTADMVREAVFNIIGPELDGIRVLDLFAGTGALGLEAMSRGAREAVFVDNHKNSLAALKQNIEILGLTGSCRVHKIDLDKSLGRLRKETEPFELIFIDPPYAGNLIEKILDRLSGSRLAAPGSLAVAEHDSKQDLTESRERWKLSRRRRYGQTMISFYQYAASENGNPGQTQGLTHLSC